MFLTEFSVFDNGIYNTYGKYKNKKDFKKVHILSLNLCSYSSNIYMQVSNTRLLTV